MKKSIKKALTFGIVFTMLVASNMYVFAGDDNAETIQSAKENAEDIYHEESAEAFQDAYQESFVTNNANDTMEIAPFLARTNYRSVVLKWNTVENSDYYEVYIKEGDSWRRKNKTTETSVTYNYLTIGQLYKYKVRAHIEKEGHRFFTDYSDEVEIMLEEHKTSLEAHLLSRKSLELEWDAIPSADYYDLYRKKGEDGSWIKHKVINGTTSTRVSITPNIYYQYKLRPHIVSDGGDYYGAFSDPIKAGSINPSIEILTSELTGFSSFDLSWANSGNCDYYEVYRKIGENGTWTRNKIVYAETIHYNLSLNKEYCFKVRGHIALDEEKFFTDYSEVVEINTSIPKVEKASLDKGTGNKYVLSWSELNNSDYYEVYRITEKKGSWRRNQVLYGQNEKEYSIKKGSFYGFKIRARLEKDEERIYSEYSDEIYIWNTDAPCIVAQEKTSKQMSLYWEPVQNADFYRIFADGVQIGETPDTSYTIGSAYIGSEISICAVLEHNNGEVVSNNSEGIVFDVDDDDDPTYRALIIGETDYSTRLNGPDNDYSFMRALVQGLENKYRVTAQQNATLDEIIELVDVAFDGATENDVSLFYYSGHGVTGAGDYYSGALQTVDYQYLTTADLAELLSKVPGKVIVILDSCGSGAAISDGTDPTTEKIVEPIKGLNSTNRDKETLGFDAEQFNNGVISIFSAYDSIVTASDNTSEPKEQQKAGELKQTKFYVITGSAYEENSLTTQIDGVWGGVLTRGIAIGTGCEYPSGSYSGGMPADTNMDNCISFIELASHCKSYAEGRQHVLSYSSTPQYIIFKR